MACLYTDKTEYIKRITPIIVYFDKHILSKIEYQKNYHINSHPYYMISSVLSLHPNYISEILFPGHSIFSFASIGSFGEIYINEISNKGLFAFFLWSIILFSFMFFINKSKNEFSFILLSIFFTNNIINQLEDYFAIRFTTFIQFLLILYLTQIMVENKLKFK